MTDSTFTVTVTYIEKFIEPQYARGIIVFKSTDLWDKLYGPPIICNTMSRNNFKSIMSFYDIRDRRQLRSKDKSSMFYETWERFINNYQACYFPEENVTTNE